MKTAIVDPIATTSLLMTRADGSRLPIVLVVGPPYVVDEIESRCPIRIDGLHGQYSDISGDDTFQALCLALRFLKRMVDHEIEKGSTFTNLEGGSPYGAADLLAIFGLAADGPSSGEAV